MASTIGIVVIFIIMCALMYTKKLSAFFALPLMAFFIALVSGIPFTDSADKTPGILTLLFVEGPVRLASAMMILIFGAILAQFVKNTGIAEETVRKVSELAGDRPLVLGISFLLVLSLLFTTLGGLGSVIMIGSIVLPIMASVGISPLTCACILLISLSTGGIFNLANWGLYIDGFGMTANEIKLFAWPLGAIFLVFGILFVIVQTKLNGHLFKKKQISWPDPAPATQCKKINPLALLTPIVPLVMVFVLKVNIIGAFTVAIIYCFITTINKDSLKNLSKSVTQGIADSAGAIFLIIGIGMLLKVVMDPRVTAHIGQPLASVLPSHALSFILFFGILAPLALYRGPLNIWGLGLGLGAVMLSTGKLSSAALMAALMATGQIQGICDPTNTHNVWTAAATGTDVNDILRKTLPFVWAASVIGLIIAGFMFF